MNIESMSKRELQMLCKSKGITIRKSRNIDKTKAEMIESIQQSITSRYLKNKLERIELAKRLIDTDRRYSMVELQSFKKTYLKMLCYAHSLPITLKTDRGSYRQMNKPELIDHLFTVVGDVSYTEIIG